MGEVIDLDAYKKRNCIEVIEQIELTIDEQYNIAFVEILKEYSGLEEYYTQLYN